jgi:predicted AAA+ superfamily ATPase
VFQRKILFELQQWSASPYRKSLILRGARQVGKTTAVRMFAKEFDTFIELNLEDEADRRVFISGTDAQTVYNLMLLRKEIRQVGNRVLIFIDEIQNSPEALLSLRYFYEKLPELYIIAAGSLLDVYLRRNRLEVSVGRVEYLWMYPCDFEEYLQAAGYEQILTLVQKIPFPDYAYPVLREKFMEFALIGGMPEAIQIWLETKSIIEVRSILNNVLQAYRDDAVKYAVSPEQANVLQHIMNTAYSEVGKQITFEGFGGSDFKSQTIKSAFLLLEQSSIIKMLYPYTSTVLPTVPNRTKRPKLLFLDTGFINMQANIQAEYFSSPNLNSIYKGIAMEHLIGQQLISMQKPAGFELGFWVRNARSSSAEVDYVLIWNNQMIPVEVKSGKTGTLKSLFLFMEEAEHNIAVRIYDGVTNWEKHKTPKGKEFNLLNLNLGLTTRVCRYLNGE